MCACGRWLASIAPPASAVGASAEKRRPDLCTSRARSHVGGANRSASAHRIAGVSAMAFGFMNTRRYTLTYLFLGSLFMNCISIYWTMWSVLTMSTFMLMLTDFMFFGVRASRVRAGRGRAAAGGGPGSPPALPQRCLSAPWVCAPPSGARADSR